jgi:hypothetical protein
MPDQFVINSLRLQYPPISAQEADWLKEDAEAVALFKNSRFYMIGQRRELLFEEPELDPETGKLHVAFRDHTGMECKGQINLDAAGVVASLLQDKKITIEAGPKLIRISEVDSSGEPQNILRWYTVDLLLFNKWRGDKAIEGFDNYREFSKYLLYYVGIATKGDSFQRLIERAHEKRLSILTNESQIKPTARLSDEIILFLFDSVPLLIRSFSLEEDFSEFGSPPPYGSNQPNIDAEKAFTFFLDTKYNTIKYQEFPKGADGFYGRNILRYAHVIDEDVEFVTAKGSFRGGFGAGLPCSNDCDAIFVEGDHARLLKVPTFTSFGVDPNQEPRDIEFL